MRLGQQPIKPIWTASTRVCRTSCPRRQDHHADSAALVNPFSKRESHSSSTVITYKVLTVLTWLLSVIVSIYYSVESPADDLKHGRTIVGQNALHPSGFTLNFVLVDIYLSV